jgi:uncharacterized membrane protein
MAGVSAEPADEAPDAETRRLREDWARNLDNRVKAALLGLLALAAMVYPLAVTALIFAAGLRVAAAVFAVLGLLSSLRSQAPERRLAGATAAGLAGAAAASGRIEPLLLLPALIYAALAATFFASLGSPVSAVERAARAIQPAAPDFIARYCRIVTAVWAAVFALCAVAVATAAVAAPLSTWNWIAGRGLWTGMAVVVAVEFLVRKTYFRNYWYGGPFERLWSRLFPAEATEMGRRSAAHIREVRRKLGLDTRDRG